MYLVIKQALSGPFIPKKRITRGIKDCIITLWFFQNAENIPYIIGGDMVKYILFMDVLRQEEIEKFYKACQMHREYYKGYPKSYHPLTYFKDSEYMYQCPADMTQTYLSFPPFHIKYKQPAILPHNIGRTSGMPQLPDRCLAARYNKLPCKAFIR